MVVVIVLSLISLVSKLMGFVREQVIASSFGVSMITDAYVAAQLLPSILTLVISGAAAAVVVPLYTGATADRDGKRARSVSFTLLVFLGLIFLGETLVLYMWSPDIMHMLVPGLSQDALAKGVSLARVAAPTVLLVGVSAVLTALLNVDKHFVIPGLAALGANVSIIVAVVIFRNHITVEQVSWAIVLGNVVQLIVLVMNLRFSSITVGLSKMDWNIVRQVCQLSIPLVLANGIMQLAPITDKFLASHMTEGSIAALNYSLKLVQLPVGVIVMGLSTVLFTRFAQLAESGERKSLANEVGRTLRWLLVIMLPVTALAIALAEPIVSVAFKRGQFDQEAVITTANALGFHALGLLPMAAYPVLVRALFSLRNTRNQLTAGVAATGIYFSVALLLRGSLGLKALALSFAMGQVASLLIILLELHRELGPSPFSITRSALVPALVGTVAVYLISRVGTALTASPLWQLVSGTIFGVLVYIAVHLVLKSDEIKWIRAALRKVIQ